MLSINTNLSSLIAQRSMKQSTNSLNQAIERMTTGAKINHAKDNAANYNIATNMTTKLGALQVAEDNCAMSLDLITTANDTLNQFQYNLERLRNLQEQANNETCSQDTLNAINTEANALVKEINRLYHSTEYNGLKLFGSGEVESIPEVAMLATVKTGENATIENYFISDPVSYTDTQIADMKTMTDLINGITSPTNEYSISSKEELEALANYVNSGNDTTNMTFVLGADVDLITIDNWTPIGGGATSYYFSGTFDGNGHVIKNLTASTDTVNDYGLFGYALNAIFRNVGLIDVEVIGTNEVGGLVAKMFGTIDNCFVTGSVTGRSRTGGLVGYGDVIENSYTSVDILSTTNSGTMGIFYGSIGGLAGRAKSIDNCFSTGDIVGTHALGGLVGEVDSVTKSFATGNVIAITGGIYAMSYVGGLAGSASSIDNCYTTGNVIDNRNNGAGGLAGSGSGAIKNSFALGSVQTSSTNFGGLVEKDNYFSVTNCASVQPDIYATLKTKEEILNSLDTMGFTTENGWIRDVDGMPIIAINYTRPSTDSSQDEDDNSSTTPDSPVIPDSSTQTNPLFKPVSGKILLQIGNNSDWSSQIDVNTNLSINGLENLRMIGVDKNTDYLSQIDGLITNVSEKQTYFGAVSNRLESALDEISTQYENLVSSLSTLQDADIAEVSSEYIRQQILQQASATLLATANQSPSIALQLI